MGNRYEELYVKIDSKRLLKDGEIVITSEPLTADVIIGRTGKGPKGGFDILRIKPFCDMLKRSGNSFCKVMALLLESKNLENFAELSTIEIARKTGLSKCTVMKVIDKMEEASFAVQGYKKIMINPHAIHKGNSIREGYLFSKFDEMMRESRKGEYAKEYSADEENNA